MSSLEKTGYVKNPSTGRPIKIGSRNWHILVRQGILSGENFQDEKVLYQLKQTDNVEDTIKEINSELPYNIQAVKGRGKYKDKLVKRTKPLENLSQTVDIVTKASIEAIKQLPQQALADEEDLNDWENQLHAMIMEELLEKPKNAPKLSLKDIKGGMIYKKPEHYQEKELSEDSQEESESEDSQCEVASGEELEESPRETSDDNEDEEEDY